MPCEHAWVVHVASASSARIHNNDANRHPCLTPFVAESIPPPPSAFPFTSSENDWEVIHIGTHVVLFSRKPLRLIDDHKKSQSKESYTLAKSTFHMKPFVPLIPHAATILAIMTALVHSIEHRNLSKWDGMVHLVIHLHDVYWQSAGPISCNVSSDMKA